MRPSGNSESHSWMEAVIARQVKRRPFQALDGTNDSLLLALS